MVEITYKESIYRFIDPIRYFKANDPYYYLVDNIPLKQLMENDLWLKDQIGNLPNLDSIEIDRSGFSELKPYVLGINSTVKVKPGRFTARINHAYNLTPLQILGNVSNHLIGETDVWSAKTIQDSLLSPILQKFKSALEANSLSLNGLIGKSFSYASLDRKTAISFGPSGSPDYNLVGNNDNRDAPYPILQAKLWAGDSTNTTYRIYQHENILTNIGFASLPIADLEFVKKWRSAIRTAVVDVPSELEIDIPPFDEQDHYYLNESGVKTILPATQRIDLLFVYSKPIDSPSATIMKFTNDSPTTITTPQLGIVRGAGLGVDYRDYAGAGLHLFKVINATDADGNPQILSHIADENNQLLGFTGSGIHGSFPAPDDLMNLTPQLLESLESNNYMLIGQSVLPVAYVVVRKNGTSNLAGQPVIVSEDLIDIRPFFRTTELSYNERAGIAAAFPSTSFANPIATEGFVNNELRKIISDYNTKITNVNGSTNGPPTGSTAQVNLVPRIVAGGYVRGGGYFGVEGAIMNLIKNKYNNALTYEALKTELTQRYGMLPEDVIPNLPNWDLAQWCVQGNLQDKGLYPNDYINFHRNLGRAYNYASYSDKNLTTQLQKLGPNIETRYDIYFVKKTVRLNRSQLQWMRDYHVDAQLWNCIPLSYVRGIDTPEGVSPPIAGISNIWVDKKSDEFTIFVSWPIFHIEGGSNLNVPERSRDGPSFAGFMVINNELVSTPWIGGLTTGESSAAITTYPTVTFQVTGYPFNYNGLALDMSNPNPVITLA